MTTSLTPATRQSRPSATSGQAAEPHPTPLLAAVVIARNEAEFIGPCLERVLAATATLGDCETVLVDSCSTDRTLEIASGYPVRVVELNPSMPLCPALGRFVGQQLTRSRYVLFVDGDTVIESEWLRAGLAALDADPTLAGVGGKLREIYLQDGCAVGENPDCFNTANATIVVDQLGGNALYRRSALDSVGSFNPYVSSYEEAELAERLRKAGYQVVRLPVLLGTHRTSPPGTLREFRRRRRENLMAGHGRVLRLALHQGLFWPHARSLKRYLQFIALLALGITTVVISLLVRSPAPIIGWAALCATLCIALAAKSRSITKPARLMADWAFMSIPLIMGFLRSPAEPHRFSVREAVAAERSPARREDGDRRRAGTTC